MSRSLSGCSNKAFDLVHIFLKTYCFAMMITGIGARATVHPGRANFLYPCRHILGRNAARQNDRYVGRRNQISGDIPVASLAGDANKSADRLYFSILVEYWNIFWRHQGVGEKKITDWLKQPGIIQHSIRMRWLRNRQGSHHAGLRKGFLDVPLLV